jgi:uncharacterized membrane protein YbhN (UPF0104 family)
MSIKSQPGNSGFTRLRDFGAFQTLTPLPTRTPVMVGGDRSLAEQDTRYLLPAVSLSSPRDSVRSRWLHSELATFLRRKWLRLSLQVVVTIALFVLLYLSISWTTLFVALQHVHKSMLLISALIGVCCIVLSAYQWHGLLRIARIHFDLADLVHLYMVGIAFSHLFPTGLGGDAVKALYVGNGDDERACSSGVLILCRITGFLAMLLIALPALYIWRSQINKQLSLWLCVLIIFFSFAIAALSFLLAFLCRFHASPLHRYPPLHSLFKLVASLGHRLWQPLALLRATLYGWIFWGAAILNCYCYASSLGLSIPFYFFLIAVPFTALVSAIPVSLNGFGLREGAFVFAFTTVHVSSAHALLLALLLDFQALCFAVAGTYLYFTRIKKWRKQNAPNLYR